MPASTSAANSAVAPAAASTPAASPAAASPAKELSAAEAADKATAALAAIRARQQADTEAAAALVAAQASGSAQAQYAEPGSTTYPYAILKDKNSRPAEVDPSKKEMYLSDAEFTDLFKLTKTEFKKLPEWRQKALKTPMQLF